MHLLIPYAICLPKACRQAWAGLKLPNLKRLLAQLTQQTLDPGTEQSFSPPHERVLAQLCGLVPPAEVGSAYRGSEGGGNAKAQGREGEKDDKSGKSDGQIPWGALFATQAGLAGVDCGSSSVESTTNVGPAWAVITPCHWSLQTQHIVLPNPALLQLQEDESRTLLAAMQPYFAEDGITLLYEQPDRWLAQGAVFRNLRTASLDRAIGRNIHDWLPQTPEGKNLRRLQNEMQMLLYTHPVNDVRSARRQDAVNAFWVSGTGALPLHTVPANRSDFCFADALRTAALQEDWASWGQAWQQLDATECAALLQTLAANKSASLTLCGERSALTLRYAANRPWERVLPIFKAKLGLLPAFYEDSSL